MKVREIFDHYDCFKCAVLEDINDIFINSKKFENIISYWCGCAWSYNYEYYFVIDSIIISINAQRHYR